MSNPRRDSELDRLNLALSSAEMGTWDWNLPTGVFWWDERMYALFGLAPGAFKGTYEDFLGLIHEEDRERIRKEFTRAIAERVAMDTEFQVAWPPDRSKPVVRMRSRIHCDDNTEISRIAGVAWDVTERRQADLALDKERSLLSTLMDKLPYTFYFKDLDSRFVAVSRTLAEYHGRKDPAQLIGLTDRDLFSSEHAEGALADEREIIRTGKPIIDYEEKESWPDREDTWASTTKMPWRDAQDTIIGTFGISHDITEKKRRKTLSYISIFTGSTTSSAGRNGGSGHEEAEADYEGCRYGGDDLEFRDDRVNKSKRLAFRYPEANIGFGSNSDH